LKYWLVLGALFKKAQRREEDGSMRKEDVAVHPSRDADSLRAAFTPEGCPICTVVLEYMNLAMDTWNYEGFTDVEHRHALIRSRGFCPLHTWQLAQRNNAFQLALIYREVLTDLLAHYELTAISTVGATGVLARIKAKQRGEYPCTQQLFAAPARVSVPLASVADDSEVPPLFAVQLPLCSPQRQHTQEHQESRLHRSVPLSQ
jgi:hypothetical protein